MDCCEKDADLFYKHKAKCVLASNAKGDRETFAKYYSSQIACHVLKKINYCIRL